MPERSDPDGPTPDGERLRGKVALVTGGAGGFGRAVTRGLVERGAQVALCDIDEARTTEAAAEFGALPVTLDVRDRAAHRRAVATVEEHFGGLDITFLNAGVTSGMTGADPLDDDGYRRIMGINVDGVVYGADAALPALRRRGGGTIVATASMAGLVSMPGDPYYTLTKAAVVGYVRSLGPELAREGIRVHALCPGFADTAIIDPLREAFAANDFPLLRPEDVAAAFFQALDSPDSGVAWLIQAGVTPSPFRFRGVPAARHADGRGHGVPADLDPHGDTRIATTLEDN